jgi:hypothetical protein
LLTKIKGTAEQYEDLIGRMINGASEPSNSKLYKFFDSDEAKKISHFRLAKNEVCRKAKELCIYGYAN